MQWVCTYCRVLWCSVYWSPYFISILYHWIFRFCFSVLFTYINVKIISPALLLFFNLLKWSMRLYSLSLNKNFCHFSSSFLFLFFSSISLHTPFFISSFPFTAHIFSFLSFLYYPFHSQQSFPPYHIEDVAYHSIGCHYSSAFFLQTYLMRISRHYPPDTQCRIFDISIMVFVLTALLWSMWWQSHSQRCLPACLIILPS